MGWRRREAAGVRHCIDILAQELRMTMQLCGARDVAELDRSMIRHQQPQAGPTAGARTAIRA